MILNVTGLGSEIVSCSGNISERCHCPLGQEGAQYRFKRCFYFPGGGGLIIIFKTLHGGVLYSSFSLVQNCLVAVYSAHVKSRFLFFWNYFQPSLMFTCLVLLVGNWDIFSPIFCLFSSRGLKTLIQISSVCSSCYFKLHFNLFFLKGTFHSRIKVQSVYLWTALQ